MSETSANGRLTIPTSIDEAEQMSRAGREELIPIAEREWVPARDTGKGFTPPGGFAGPQWASSQPKAEAVAPEAPEVAEVKITADNARDYLPDSWEDWSDDEDSPGWALRSSDDDIDNPDDDGNGNPDPAPAPLEVVPEPVKQSDELTVRIADARQRLNDVMENQRRASGRDPAQVDHAALDQAVKQAQAELSDLDFSLNVALHEELAPGLKTSSDVEAAIAELDRWAEDQAYEADQMEKAGRPLRAADLRAEATAKLGELGERRAELTIASKYKQGQELVERLIEDEARAAVAASFTRDIEAVRQAVTAKSGKAAGDSEANLTRLRLESREPSGDGRADEWTLRFDAARQEARERHDRKARAKHLKSGAILER